MSPGFHPQYYSYPMLSVTPLSLSLHVFLLPFLSLMHSLYQPFSFLAIREPTGVSVCPIQTRQLNAKVMPDSYGMTSAGVMHWP